MITDEDKKLARHAIWALQKNLPLKIIGWDVFFKDLMVVVKPPPRWQFWRERIGLYKIPLHSLLSDRHRQALINVGNSKYLEDAA